MALSPRRIDISQDNLTQDFSVDPEKFKKCCRTFFPIHRIFVNYKQLYAAADLLFRQWKVLMKTSKKSIRCNYSHTPHKGCKKIIDSACLNLPRTRTTRVNLKKQIQCPFCINWSLVDHKRPYKDDPYDDDIF